MALKLGRFVFIDIEALVATSKPSACCRHQLPDQHMWRARNLMLMHHFQEGALLTCESFAGCSFA